MKRKNTKNTIIVRILLLFVVCVMAFSGYQLWEIRQAYATGDRNYEALTDLVKEDLPDEDLPDDLLEKPEEQIPKEQQLPDQSIDFAALQAINKDAVAWIYSLDTVIDYPVMRSDDYDWYLHHLPDGTYNANGTLFLDYNNPSDFSGRLNIIYGHHMKSGKMFGSLVGYKQQTYFEEHPYLYLYTAESGNYRIDLAYGCVIGAGEWRERAFMYELNLSSLLSYAAHNTTFESDVTYTEEDQFVVLSTCSYEFDDARYVVIGVLRSETDLP